jgi:NitT/TauT family transport system substrate-binding protein
MSILHRCRLLSSLLVLGLVGAACTSTTGTSPSAASGSPVKMTYMFDWSLPSDVTKMPYLMAQKLGWYQAAGLDVNFVYPPVAPADKYLAAGKVDGATLYPIDVLTMIAAGAKFTIVGAIYDQLSEGLAFYNASGIRTPQDLYGKTVAIYDNPGARGFFKQFEACHHLNPSKINEVSEGGYGVPIIVAGRAQAIDAGATGELVDMVLEGHKSATYWLYDQAQCIPNVYGWNLAFTPQFIQAHPEAVRKFVAVTLRGVQYVIHHPSQSLAYFDQLYPATGASRNALAWQYMKKYVLLNFTPQYPDGYEDLALWQKYQPFAVRLHLIPQTVDVAAHLTNQFVPKG